MLNTQSVKHDYKRFFLLPDDLLAIAKRYCWRARCAERHAYPFATSLRVLETWKDDLLKKLDETGLSEEDLTEEMLWIDTEWQPFCQRALHLFEARTFQKTLPRLIDAGYAKQRYIKRDASGQGLFDETGQPLVYITYQDARRDKQYPGEIIHQVLFLSDAVNAAIAALSSPPPPPPDRPPETKEKGDAEQGGNLADSSPLKESQTARGGNPDTAGHSNGTIPHPSQKCEGESSFNIQNSHLYTNAPQMCEGGAREAEETFQTPRKNAQDPSQKREVVSQKCEDPVRKSASNKNLNKEIEKESEKESLISAGGAADILSQFDFFRSYDQQAILDLAALILPLKDTYKSEERKQKAQMDTEKAAAELAANTFLRERGLPHLARLLCYLSDPSSPCQWRSYILGQNPGVQIRLWHLTEKVARLASREMETCDWWPACLAPQIAQPQPPVAEVSTVDLDMAELREIAPECRQGMDRESACDLVAYVHALFHDFPSLFVNYFSVSHRRADRSRGYYVDFRCEDIPMIRLYSLADWDLLVAHAEFLGTPDFVPRLAEAVREVFIA